MGPLKLRPIHCRDRDEANHSDHHPLGPKSEERQGITADRPIIINESPPETNRPGARFSGKSEPGRPSETIETHPRANEEEKGTKFSNAVQVRNELV